MLFVNINTVIIAIEIVLGLKKCLIGVTRPTLVTLPTLDIFINFSNKKKKEKKENLKKKKKHVFFTFFPCDACLRRWISPLVPTALFSIIFKHPSRNQFSKTSD